ncbi:MAG: translation initiation factor IF-2 N-terminal domain-containing protein, partial [Planctomycetaceae bacterium]
MKIRIFALARDLGLDSKVLIDLCEEAGVKLRNALATISEEERDQVVAYLRRKGTPGASDIPTTEIPPVREQQNLSGRVRVIGASGRGTMRTADGQPYDAGVSSEGEPDELESGEAASVEPAVDAAEAATPAAEPEPSVEVSTEEAVPESVVQAQ